jgi:hypothetical protein
MQMLLPVDSHTSISAGAEQEPTAMEIIVTSTISPAD